eukprot:SAG31_NODE_14051_length_830_cov_0.772914_1_plen_51_part_10
MQYRIQAFVGHKSDSGENTHNVVVLISGQILIVNAKDPNKLTRKRHGYKVV